jgi:thiol-disulfide isomerase/thioredoxin
MTTQIEDAPVASLEAGTPQATRQPSAARWIWWGMAVLIAVAGAFWVWNSRIPDATLTELRTPAPALGHPAPPFATSLLDGSTVELAALAGTPVVLNFWATWCGPCRAEMPALERAAQRYAGNVTVLGINQAEDPATIQQFVDEFGLTFPIALDADQAIGADLYNVTGLPTTYFVDGTGTIRRIWMGEMNSVTLEEGIAEILQSPTP